jgi:hypothetical protein
MLSCGKGFHYLPYQIDFIVAILGLYDIAICHSNRLKGQATTTPNILWTYCFMQYCKYRKLNGIRYALLQI